MPFAHAATIQAGNDVQAAIEGAMPGDTIVVGPGDYGAFDVDRPVTVAGSGMPRIQAGLQSAAIILSADGSVVSGFDITGVSKNPETKFSYYMENPEMAGRLNMPNAAVEIRGRGARIENSSIRGAQVGVYAEGGADPMVRAVKFDGCDTGVSLLRCSGGTIEGCAFLGSGKAAIYAQGASGLLVANSSLLNSTHAGLLLKESAGCRVLKNKVSGNTEGIALWNSSENDVSGNYVDHNYYGIVLSGSNNNTVTENTAYENSRSEIVKGFGIGISLQEDSCGNVIALNSAKKGFNGIELIRGCEYNVVYGNDASDNIHGLRMDKNRNNLIYGNTFARNRINAYENMSRNLWNSTTGNFYSDYRGVDGDGDGIGDTPYALSGPESKSEDRRPLMSPAAPTAVNATALKAEAGALPAFPTEEEEAPYRVEGGAIVIKATRPSSPPKWGDDKWMDGGSIF